MKYMLLFYVADDGLQGLSPDELQGIQRSWGQFLNAVKSTEGAVTDGLAPVTAATTVRVRNGKTLTTDGPFAETHEHLGGYLLVDCKDLDEAIAWAEKVPHARYGSVEIRPMWNATAG